MTRHVRNLLVLWTLAALPSLCSCGALTKGVGDLRVTTENVLNDLITALNNNSQDWQRLVQDAQSQLTDDAQSTIRNELSALVTRSIGQAGVEVRCTGDWIGARVREEVQRILARFRGQTPPARQPNICQWTPTTVLRAEVPARVTQVEYYGYNFDRTTLTAMHYKTGGAREDVTFALDTPSHYAITLRFGANGVQLTPDSERIVLLWQDREELSSVGVVQPTIPACQTLVDNLDSLKVTWTPPLSRADREFAGNGPRSEARISLRVDPTSIRARIYMRAAETASDWTTAQGETEALLYTAPAGWQIHHIDGPTAAFKSYVDGTITLDSFAGAGGLVRNWVFEGDTPGDDAGTRTRVDVTFNRLAVTRVQTTDCQPAGPPPPLPEFIPNCFWTDAISEEQPAGAMCPSGFAARGIECTGSYCDDVALYCCPYQPTPDPAASFVSSIRISEESPSNRFDGASQLVSGVTCDGRYCDGMRGQLVSSPAVRGLTACSETAYVSEEGRGQALCGEGSFITGLRCRGRFCDDVAAQCCRPLR